MDDFHKQKTLPDLTTGQAHFPMPEKIGPYRIESLLSKGGMSLLYLGAHPDTAQPIAIKVLLPKYLKHKEIVNRFLKEAQIIEMTHHPNIVQLYGQGQWEKGLYIAMEFIQGVSLRQFIQQKSLSQKRALEIILQVAYALCHLHTHGVIHRDLKPENILITETGAIKVIDFGIAQLHGEVEPEMQKNQMVGTPVYMSPEQKKNPNSISYASDIYSLGMIAYELLLGRLSHGVVQLALLPRSVRPIIEKALQPDPKARYPDIVDFITDVSQCIRAMEEEPKKPEEEISEEILQMIQQTHALLAPKKAPAWPQLEIGIAIHEGQSLSGLYFDFFHLPENRYCIVLAEPLASGVISLLHAAVFRGMVRMMVQKDFHSVKMLNALNQTLHRDPMYQHFSLCFLLLSPDRDQLSFVSCHSPQLWHLPEGSQTVRSLTTPNPALGADPAITLLETADNWNAGDTLILHSLAVASKEDASHIALEHALLFPQTQAEKILQALVVQKGMPQKACAVLSLQRIF